MTDSRNVMEQLAGLLDDAFAPKRQRCSFGKLLDDAPEKVRNALNALMANRDISTRKIHMILKKSGASIGRDTIADHKNERCTCFPSKPFGSPE